MAAKLEWRYAVFDFRGLFNTNAVLFFIFLFFACAAMGGCGLARGGELHLLAAENAPPPPAGKRLEENVSTLLIAYAYPTISERYSSPRPVDEVVKFYSDLLKAKGWKQLDIPSDALIFSKHEMRLELRVIPRKSKDKVDETFTEATIMIQTRRVWEFRCLGWIQGTIWFATGQSHDSPDPTVVRLIQLF